MVGAPLKPCSKPCVSPLHTHDESGVLHVENDAERRITLGQFFTEWGVRFSPDCVGGYCAPDKPHQVYVNGKPFTVQISTTADSFEPSYGELTTFPQSATPTTATVTIEPAPGSSVGPLWGFITVTNNDTQHITAISPQP